MKTKTTLLALAIGLTTASLMAQPGPGGPNRRGAPPQGGQTQFQGGPRNMQGGVRFQGGPRGQRGGRQDFAPAPRGQGRGMGMGPMQGGFRGGPGMAPQMQHGKGKAPMMNQRGQGKNKQFAPQFQGGPRGRGTIMGPMQGGFRDGRGMAPQIHRGQGRVPMMNQRGQGGPPPQFGPQFQSGPRGRAMGMSPMQRGPRTPMMAPHMQGIFRGPGMLQPVQRGGGKNPSLNQRNSANREQRGGNTSPMLPPKKN